MFVALVALPTPEPYGWCTRISDSEKTGNVVAHLLFYLLHLTVCGTLEKARSYVDVPMASALGLRLYYSNDHWGSVKHH